MNERTHRKGARAALLGKSQARQIVQSVRRIGCGARLTEEEAVTVALEQSAVFANWVKSGAAIRTVEIWVGGKMLITASQKEAWAQLDLFAFDLKGLGVPLSEAVMQLVNVTADNEQVVLLNLALSDIPGSGLNEVKRLPNGKAIGLLVKQPESGRFKVTVAFDASASAVMNARCGSDVDVAALSTLGGGATAIRRIQSAFQRLTTRLTAAALAPRIAYLTLVAGLGGLMLFGPSGYWNAKQSVHPLITNAIAGNSPTVAKPPTSKTDSSRNLTAWRVLPETVTTDPKARAGHQATKKTEVRSSVAATKPPKAQSTAALAQVAFTNNARPRKSSSWEVRRSQKLSTMRAVYIEFAGNGKAAKRQLAVLEQSFVQAWKSREKATIVPQKNKADALIRVKFQSYDDCVGVVFMEILEPDGKNTLWTGDEGCKHVGKGQLAELFANVSLKLLKAMHDETASPKPTLTQTIPAPTGNPSCREKACPTGGRDLQRFVGTKTATQFRLPR